MALNDNPGAMASYEDNPSQMPGYTQPRRLSIASLLSLISSLIFCIPIITQVFGIIFGIFGIVIISRNHDRRKGLGLAISGIAVSILVLIVYLVIALSLNKFIQHFPNSSNQFLTNLQAGNTTQARLWLDATIEKTVTDNNLSELATHLNTDYGQFKNAQIYWSFQVYQILQQPDIPDQFKDAIPVSLDFEFDKDTIHVLAILKQNLNASNLDNMFLIERLYFIPPNGKVWQFPKATSTAKPATTKPNTTPANQPPDADKTPPQNKPDSGG